MNLNTFLAASVAVFAIAGTAQAATLKMTESGRDQIAGTTVVVDNGGAIDLGEVTDTDYAATYGRIFNAGTDDYTFSVAAGVTATVMFDFGTPQAALAGALALEQDNGSFLVGTGLIGIGSSEGSADFVLGGDSSGTQSFTTNQSALVIPPVAALLFTVGEGDYTFDITGTGGGTGQNPTGAFYDIKISGELIVDEPSPIPLPASALLLLGAVGGLGFASRRKKA